MKYTLTLIFTTLFLISCSEKKPSVKDLSPSIVGTWQLTSSQIITGKDTTYNYFENIKGIKIINKSHFAFFQHDLNKGKDSTTVKFSSGSGNYILQNNNYTEYLEYCSAREWEDNTFNFTVKVTNDSLIQTGIEKVASLNVDRIIIENYVRVNESQSPLK